MSSKCVVIGVGNRWRRDDGAGPTVAEAIAGLDLPAVTVHVWEKECSGLLEVWDDAACVYVIDAALGNRAGDLHEFDAISGSIPAEMFGHSSHDFGVAEAVELARALNRLPARLTVYGITGDDFDHGIGLSPEVEATTQSLLCELRKTLKDGCI